MSLPRGSRTLLAEVDDPLEIFASFFGLVSELEDADFLFFGAGGVLFLFLPEGGVCSRFSCAVLSGVFLAVDVVITPGVVRAFLGAGFFGADLEALPRAIFFGLPTLAFSRKKIELTTRLSGILVSEMQKGP